MKKNGRIQGFVMGVLCSVLIASLTVPSFATAVDVLFNSVNLSVDGKTVASIGEGYTLDNGTQVPFSLVYNGTTYLPVRKIGEIFNKEIDWDASTSTVYVGKVQASQEYYPGTQYLTFTSVTGTPLKNTHSEDGLVMYSYDYKDYGNSDNAWEYISYLQNCGFRVIDESTENSTYTLYYLKGSELFVVAIDFQYDFVIIFTTKYGKFQWANFYHSYIWSKKCFDECQTIS